MDALMTPDEVSGILRVSKRQVYDLANEGALKSVRVGRAVRFRPADVQAFVDGSAQSSNVVRLKRTGV